VTGYQRCLAVTSSIDGGGFAEWLSALSDAQRDGLPDDPLLLE
jgi:hypothetical protein